jgi:hypothetical protein
MHDIDSTRLEFSPEYESEYETHPDQTGAAHSEHSGKSGDCGCGGHHEKDLSESEEEALAAELLGVSSEEEMDQFLGGLFKKIAGTIGGAASHLLGKVAGPLAGALKGIAAKALPFVGGALGSAIPIPGVGTAIGTALGTAASNLLQSEMDNLPLEEQEFDTARRFVRLASHAARHAVRDHRNHNPRAAANLAIRHAVHSWRRSRDRRYWRRTPAWQRHRYYQNAWPGIGGYAPAYDMDAVNPIPDLSQCPACPPCPLPPPCPVCDSPAVSDPAAFGADASAGSIPPASAAAPGGTPSPEMEMGYSGEAESEGEYYDDPDSSFHSHPYYHEHHEHYGHHGHHGHHRGHWVRHGRKIVLYGL